LPYPAQRVEGTAFCAHSNKGFVYTAVDGNQFPDIDSAANYLFHRRYFLDRPVGITERLVSHSSLLSLCWGLSWRLREKYVYESERQNPQNTLEALKGAAIALRQAGVTCQVLIVPELKEAGYSTAKLRSRYQMLEEGLLQMGFHVNWANYGPDSYRPYPDAHWNNIGHCKAAMQIHGIVEKFEFRKD
jgi:hypothetical protein